MSRLLRRLQSLLQRRSVFVCHGRRTRRRLDGRVAAAVQSLEQRICMSVDRFAVPAFGTVANRSDIGWYGTPGESAQKYLGPGSFFGRVDQLRMDEVNGYSGETYYTSVAGAKWSKVTDWLGTYRPFNSGSFVEVIDIEDYSATIISKATEQFSMTGKDGVSEENEDPNNVINVSYFFDDQFDPFQGITAAENKTGASLGTFTAALNQNPTYTLDLTSAVTGGLAAGHKYMVVRFVAATPDTFTSIDLKPSKFGSGFGEVTYGWASMNVTAQYDGDASQTKFGDYLTGVKLNNLFSVSLTSGGGADLKAIAKLEVKIDGVAVSITKLDDAHYQFNYDTGKLTKGSHQITVKALNSKQVFDSFTGAINVVDKITADFQAKAGGPAVNADEIRLIQGMDQPVTFTATVSNFNLLSAYQKLLAFTFFKHGTSIPVQPGGLNTFSGSTLSLALSDADSSLPSWNGASSLDDDYDLVLTPTGEAAEKTSDATRRLTGSESFPVVPLPKWMGTPVSRGISSNAYSIELSFPDKLQKDLGTTSGTPFGLFDGLASFIGTGFHIEITAPLLVTLQPTAKVKDWFADVTILGQNFFSKSTKLSGFGINDIDLDPLTLKASGFSFTTSEIDLLAKKGGVLNLINKQISIPFKGPAGIGLTLTGKLQAQLSSLTAYAGLGVKIANDGTVTLNDKTSFLVVSAQTRGLASLSGTVKIAGDLASASLGVAALTRLDMNLGMSFSGAPLSPQVRVPSDNSYAALTVGVKPIWDVSLLNKKIAGADYTAADLDQMVDSKTIPLFGTSKLPESEVSDLKAAKLGGDKTFAFNDHPTLGTDGRVAAIAAAARPALRLQALSTNDLPYIGAMTFSGSMDRRIRSVDVSYQVLANKNALTAGKHIATVALLKRDGSEIVLGTIDLAEPSLATGANPLGFQSGVIAKSFNVDLGQLVFGEYYQLAIRLNADQAGTGEVGAISVTGVTPHLATPQLIVAAGMGSIADGVLNFPGDTGGFTTGTLLLRNTGSAPLNATIAVPAGFTLLPGAPASLTLFPGDLPYALKIKAVSPTAKSGVLTLTTNDPAQPTYKLTLSTNGNLNDPPVIAAFDTTITYVENAAPLLLDNDATITDADSPDFAGGKLIIKLSANAQSTDLLGIKTGGSGASAVTVDQFGVNVGGFLIASFTGGAGTAPLVFSFNSSATAARVQTLLRAVTFRNTSESPSGNPRTVQVTLSDGDGGTSQAVAKTVNVTPVNDRPVVAIAPDAITYAKGSSPLLLDRNSTVTDPDSSNFATGVLTIAISAGAQATDVLSFKPSGSGATLVAINGNQVLVGGILIGTLTGGTNKTPLAVTFNSSATPTRVQNLLRSLAFSNTSSNPPTAARTMRITLSDGAGGTSAAVTKKIQIGL